jgi:hypothetical protein
LTLLSSKLFYFWFFTLNKWSIILGSNISETSSAVNKSYLGYSILTSGSGLILFSAYGFGTLSSLFLSSRFSLTCLYGLSALSAYYDFLYGCDSLLSLNPFFS